MVDGYAPMYKGENIYATPNQWTKHPGNPICEKNQESPLHKLLIYFSNKYWIPYNDIKDTLHWVVVQMAERNNRTILKDEIVKYCKIDMCWKPEAITGFYKWLFKAIPGADHINIGLKVGLRYKGN